MNLSLIINNFDLQVSKTDEGLHIEAHDQASGNIFSKLMNKDTASGLSKDQFFDLETIFQVFEDSMKSSKSDKSSLSITKDGILTYSCKVSFGGLSKDFGFTIELEKKEQNVNAKLEKLLYNISTKLAKIEENAVTKTDLEKIIEANDARFNTLEKVVLEKFNKFESVLSSVIAKMSGLQQAEELDLSFNPSGKFADQYYLSENRKAAVSREGNPSSIFSSVPLPSNKKVKFTLKIFVPNWIMVGIAPEEALNDHLAYRRKATVAYSNDGHLYAKGGHLHSYENKTLNLAKYKENDKVTFEVDLQHGKVSISLNGKHVHEHVIEKEYLQKHQFYPFIYTNRQVGCGAIFQ